jgi:hypothetical protein
VKKIVLSQNVTEMSSFWFEFGGDGKNGSGTGFYSEKIKTPRPGRF